MQCFSEKSPLKKIGQEREILIEIVPPPKDFKDKEDNLGYQCLK